MSVLVPAAAHLSRARVLLNKCLVEPYSDVRFCQVFSASKTGLSLRTSLRTWAVRTNQKTLVPVLTPLLTSVGNQSKKCLIPWKHLGNLWLETEVF